MPHHWRKRGGAKWGCCHVKGIEVIWLNMDDAVSWGKKGVGPNVDVVVSWGKKRWDQMWMLPCHGEKRDGDKHGHCHVTGKEGVGPNVDIQLGVNAQTASNHLPKTGSTVFGRYSSLLFSFFLPSTTSM